jgi:hypothetical protein
MNWSIDQIVEMYDPSNPENGTLSLARIQRAWAWNKNKAKKEEKLIDSVMHNFPIPSMIVNQVGTTLFILYDGRHRVETYHRFKHDEFTWKGKKYSELCAEDQRAFDDRSVSVLITRGATDAQLAEAFVRVNAGISLKPSDLCWAYRHENLIDAAINVICSNTRLSDAFGGLNLNKRNMLANWVGLAFGLTTMNAGNITCSFDRIQWHIHVANIKNIEKGVVALCELYERANALYPVDATTLKTYSKVGYINAFFIHEWIRYEGAQEIVDFWVGVIGETRGANYKKAKASLKTSGAQNLNSKKIAVVLSQIHEYIDYGRVPVANGDESESDDSDD